MDELEEEEEEDEEKEKWKELLSLEMVPILLSQLLMISCQGNGNLLF